MSFKDLLQSTSSYMDILAKGLHVVRHLLIHALHFYAEETLDPLTQNSFWAGSQDGVTEEVEPGSFSHVSISLLHLPPNSSLAICREGKVLHSQSGVLLYERIFHKTKKNFVSSLPDVV